MPTVGTLGIWELEVATLDIDGGLNAFATVFAVTYLLFIISSPTMPSSTVNTHKLMTLVSACTDQSVCSKCSFARFVKPQNISLPMVNCFSDIQSFKVTH